MQNRKIRTHAKVLFQLENEDIDIHHLSLLETLDFSAEFPEIFAENLFPADFAKD